jgi:hypothetical protein
MSVSRRGFLGRLIGVAAGLLAAGAAAMASKPAESNQPTARAFVRWDTKNNTLWVYNPTTGKWTSH